jgi:hypothetical protein
VRPDYLFRALKALKVALERLKERPSGRGSRLLRRRIESILAENTRG